MGDVGVRWATSADAPRIVGIDAATHSALVTPSGPFDPERDPFASRSPDDVLVAELDGVVVGYANLGHPTTLASHAHVWEVQGFAVDPAAQGGGVGRTLVEAVVAAVRERGGRKLTLRVLGHNQRARRLYERTGFHVEGILEAEFMLDGESVDDVLMARHLDEVQSSRPATER